MYHPSAVSCGQNHNVFTCILHIGCIPICYGTVYMCNRALVSSGAHRLWTPGEEIAFTARPKINSHSQIFRYGRRLFCLQHWPNFSDFFDLCLHWVSVVRGGAYARDLPQKSCSVAHQGILKVA